ncbi:MAG: hypothetical protein IK083_06395 [Abditibacteriota bacterium]|nr:hypothetical protein [Abditibacteriota bacterium]
MYKLIIAIIVLFVSASALCAMTEAETKEIYKLLNTNSYEAMDDQLNSVRDKDVTYYKLRGLSTILSRNKDSVAISNICREKLLADYSQDLSVYPYIVLIDLMNGSVEHLRETVNKLGEQKPAESDDNAILCYYLLSHLNSIPAVTVSEDDLQSINYILENNAVFTCYGHGIRYSEGMKGIGILVSAMYMPEYDESLFDKLNKTNLTQKDFMFANIICSDVASGKDGIRVYMKLLDIYPENHLVVMGLKDATIQCIEDEYLFSTEEKSLGSYYKGFIDNIDASIKKHPDNIELKSLKGGILFLAGRYDECIELCKTIESRNPYAYLFIVLSAQHTNNASLKQLYLNKLSAHYAKIKTDKKAYRLLFQVSTVLELSEKHLPSAADYAVKTVANWGGADKDTPDAFVQQLENIIRGYKHEYDVYQDKQNSLLCLLALEKILNSVNRTLEYSDYIELANACYQTIDASKVTKIGDSLEVKTGKRFTGNVRAAIDYYDRAVRVLSARNDIGNKDEIISILTAHIHELQNGEVVNGITVYNGVVPDPAKK